MGELKEPRNSCDVELSQSIIEYFARFLVPEIRKFYESEQGQKEFAEWQEQQNEHKAEGQKIGQGIRTLTDLFWFDLIATLLR